MTKVIYKCKHCSSENLRWDAWALWDEAAQEMVLHSHYDECFCEDCEGKSTPVEEVMEEDTCPECGSYELDRIDGLTCVNEYHKDDPLWEELQKFLSLK